ncbi:MAG TPA: right-handed parallel beta-helix repeat-containing protein [Sphingomonas sp.]|nr:right-handed parallel beta-helix repeat-containing protein [Sphingomonas sp.]
MLAAGNYGSIGINGRNYASGVTLQSAVSGQAHIDGLTIQNSSNLSFSGLDLGRAAGTTPPDSVQLNWVKTSSNINFNEVTFHGSLDNDPSNDGVGLYAIGVSGLKVANCTFTQLFRGLAITGSSNVSVQSNDFHDLRSDGTVVSSTDGISIDGNSYSNFHPNATDHADAIQFWNTGQTKGSSNITIKDNVLMQPDPVPPGGVQGIFISDPLTYGYKNILIQNNVLYSNGAYNGITVFGADGVQIIGNTVTSVSNDSKNYWIRLDTDSNITVRDNVTDNILIGTLTNSSIENNVNFLSTPALRAQISHLDNPASAADLVLPGTGYHVPVTTPLAPVAGAVGSGISGFLETSLGSSISKLLVADSSSQTLNMSGLKDALVSAAPVAEASAPAPAAPPVIALEAPMEVHHWAGYHVADSRFVESFTALP